MPGFVPHDAHAPLRGPPFDLQHLRQLEFHQTRMGEIKRNRDTGYTIGCKPLVGEPEVRTESQVLCVKLVIQLLDVSGQEGAVKRHIESAHRKIQQFFIGP